MAEVRIVVVGGINTDYMAQGDRLPRPGETVQGRCFYTGPGGKGANQAIAAARYGARSALVARLGTDAQGDALLACLREEGVGTACISRDPAHPSGAAVVHVDGRGEKQILTAPGANGYLAPETVGPALDIFGCPHVIVSQLEIPLPSVQAAAKWAAAHGVPFFLDPAPASPLPEELYCQLALIRPNAGEAEALTGIRVEDRETAREAARCLLDRGVSAVGVQAGDEGNLLVWRGEGKEQECFLSRVPVESVDRTGAGDAFIAALAVMHGEGRSWEEAGRFANTAAALTTTRFGAHPALPHRADVEARLNQPR